MRERVDVSHTADEEAGDGPGSNHSRGVDDNALTSAFSLVAAVASGLGLAVWSAVEGWSGPSITLAALGTVAIVLVIAVCFAVAHHYGYLEREALKNTFRVVGLAVFVVFANWFVGVLGEVRTLRAEARRPPDTGPLENAAHEGQIAELGKLRIEALRLERELRTVTEQLEAAKKETERLGSLLRDKRNVQAALSALGNLKEQWDRTSFGPPPSARRSNTPQCLAQDFSDLSRRTREALRIHGYAELDDDFTDRTTCPSTEISNSL